MASSLTDNAGNYVNGGVVSPAVLTSTAADQHVNNVVKPALAVATTGIQNQATKVAQNTQNNDQIQAALTAAKQQADKIQSEINANNAKAASTVTPSGTPPAGMDSQTYANFKAANPTLEPTAEDVNHMNQQQTLSDAQKQMAQASADYQKQAKQIQATMDSIANGTVPLSAGEQAQIDGLKQSYQALIEQQTLTNTGASGAANIRGYQTGAGEYDPTFQAKTIGSIVTAGVNKVADLNTKMASAVASLEEGFKQNDMAVVKQQFDMLQTVTKERKDTIQGIIDQTNAEIKNQQDAAQKQADAQAVEQKQINDLAQAAEKNGATADVVQAIATSPDMASALAASGTSLATAKALATGTTASGGSNVVASLNLPTVSFAGNGAPDPTSQAAFLKSLPPDVQTYVKGMADYTISPTTSAQRQYKGVANLTQEDALSLVKQYDPTYDEKQYAVRAAMQKSITSGTYSQSISAINTVIHHLDSLSQTAKALGNGTFPLLNAGKNIAQQTGGSPLQHNFNIMADAVATEMAKVYKGVGTVGEQEIKDWRNNLNANMSPAQFNGAIQSMMSLLSGRLSTIVDNYQGVMGKPLSSFGGGFQILTNSSAQALKDIGIDPTEIDPTYAEALSSDTYQGINLSGSPTSTVGTYNGVTLPN